MSEKHITRREFLQTSALVAGAALAACTPTPTPTPEPTKAPAAATAIPPTKAPEPTKAPPTAVPPTAVPPTATPRPGAWTVKYPPFTKVSPPKTFYNIRGTGAAFKFVTGDSIEYWAGDKFNEQMTGINFKPKFIYANNDEFKQKMNLAIAANDLPDFFSAFPFDLYGQLVQNKMLKDVTDLWEKNAPKEWKDMFNYRNGELWEPLRIKGRIYGFPLTKFVAQDEKLIWFRQDWLDKIGVKEPPKTLDDLYKYAKMFVDAKVAGADRPTIGIPINKDLNTWNLSTDPIFGAYGVMPGYYRIEGGKVTYMSLSAEAKEVLNLLAKWYKEGLINKEFFTLDTNKSQELVANGQAGMWFGPFWNPRGATIVDGTKNEQARGNANVKWGFAEIPTGPKGRGTKFTLPVQGAHCASVKVKDEDWIAALNHGYFVYQLTYPSKLAETKWHGFEGYNYSWTTDGCGLVTNMHPMGIPTAFTAPQIYFQAEDYKYVESLKKTFDSDPKKLDCYETALVKATFGTEDASAKWSMSYQAYTVALKAAEQYAIGTAYNGAPTATMIKEQGNLNALEQAAYIDIIVGRKPVSAFDDFAKDWKARGGDKIIGEIETELANRK